jgi:hypothetical protein
MANAAQRFFGWDVAMTLGFLALTIILSIIMELWRVSCTAQSRTAKEE